MRRTPLKEIYFDTKRLDQQVAALTNKVGCHLSDMESRTVMDHVTHMGSKIDAVNIVLKGDVTQKDRVQSLFSASRHPDHPYQVSFQDA